MMMRKLLASVALLTTAGLAAGGMVDGKNASTPCQACHGADGIGISDDERKEAVAAAAAARRPQMTGYGLFNAQKVRGEKNNYAVCLACHKGVAADSFVFTLGQLKNYRGGIAR